MLSFHVKFVQTDRRTDGQTDGQTTVKQYAPDLSIWVHKNAGSKHFLLFQQCFQRIFFLRCKKLSLCGKNTDKK